MERLQTTPSERNPAKSASQALADLSMERQITNILMEETLIVAERSEAAAIFILCDALKRRGDLPRLRSEKRQIFYVTRESREQAFRGEVQVLSIPDVPLARMAQIKLAVFLALSRQLIAMGDIIVCVTGPADGSELDTLFVTRVGHETELFSYLPAEDQMPKTIQPAVIARVVDIATELGAEGREGKPVGALFVVGDSLKVLGLSHPLILNPFHGYGEAERNILDPKVEETIKELSSIDGAFVIREDGIVESCGVFLKVSDTGKDLPHGLGARHHVAAGITAVTDSIAVSVSESTGTVVIFRRGKILTEIEKPRRLGRGQGQP